MGSWVAEIILDLAWYTDQSGSIPIYRSACQRDLLESDRQVTLYFSGDDLQLKHVRAVFGADTDDEAKHILNNNIAFWRSSIAVTSALGSSFYSGVATFDADSSLHPVLLWQGDENLPLVKMSFGIAPPQPADYEGIAKAMCLWRTDYRFHLHFLTGFLNNQLPADVRWLNGYRFLEWHFLGRKGGKLQANKDYIQLLSDFGDGLDDHKPARRTRVGFMEEIRALLAHALLATRSDLEEQRLVENAATNTFRTLEILVIRVLNEHGEGIEFKPKPERPTGTLKIEN